MILALYTSVRAWFAALPPGIKWVLAGIVAAILIGIAWALWLDAHDDRVIERHEQQRELVGSKAREKSAEEAAVDALRNQMERDKRDAAIAKAAASEEAKPPEERATTTPQALALMCAIAREDYTADELAEMPEYQEHCL